MIKTPKLALDLDEQVAFRKAKVSRTMLSRISATELARVTGIPLERCEKIVALSQFQTLGSVGPAIAEDLWALGYRSIADLRKANPRAMYERLQCLVGKPVDPCVEDVFRCAVAQAIYPELSEPLRQWWMWMDQRGTPSVGLPILDEGA
jgi:hypothetical protein